MIIAAAIILFVSRPAPPNHLVLAGNSLLDDRTSAVAGYLRRDLPDWQITNAAVMGQTTSQMLIGAGEHVDSLPRGQHNTLVVWEVTNDLALGVPRDIALAHILHYCQERARAGWTVIPVTVLPRNRSTWHSDRQFEGDRMFINSALRKLPHCCDVASDPRLSDSTNKRYFRDGLHLTDEGARIVAQRIQSGARTQSR